MKNSFICVYPEKWHDILKKQNKWLQKNVKGLIIIVNGLKEIGSIGNYRAEKAKQIFLFMAPKEPLALERYTETIE